MLCPSCGTDVGEKLALCAKCEQEIRAKHQKTAGQTGGQIGAIRPNQRIVHLKPGEQHPNAPQQPAAQQPAFGGNSAETLRSHDPNEPHRPSLKTEYPSKKVPANVLLIAVLLIILAAWFAVWIIREPKDLELFQPAQKEEPAQNFSHIVIHQKKDVVVDGQNVMGAFTLDGATTALERVEASFTPAKNLLELLYYSNEGPPPPDNPTVPQPSHDPSKPSLRVVLQFGPLAGVLDREKLQSYLIEFLSTPAPVRIANSYQRRLAGFGEVTSLSGVLKSGEIAHGEMNNHRSVEIQGKPVEANWTLIFNSPLQLPTDAKKPAPATGPKK